LCQVDRHSRYVALALWDQKSRKKLQLVVLHWHSEDGLLVV
jgi:hypothetical protein